MNVDLAEIYSHFQTANSCQSIGDYGNGNTHDTYICRGKNDYLLQKINTNIFPQPQLLMENIQKVTQFLKNKWREQGDNSERRVPTIIPTKNNKLFFKDTSGNCWRMYKFVKNTICLQNISQAKQGYEIAKFFGLFQKMLSDFPTQKLHIIQPNFHDISKRFQEMQKAIEKDICNRAIEIKETISFMLQHQSFVDKTSTWNLPMRMVHNDTKVNNILFDQNSQKAVCIIDLDLVGLGSAVYDFGDLARSVTCCKKNSLFFFHLEYFSAVLDGYLAETNSFLNSFEKETLKHTAKAIACELGFRFLTDYLQGDTYFKTRFPQHNLQRIRRQTEYIKSITKQELEIEKLVDTKLSSQ